MPLKAQNHQYVEDSARWVLDRYVRLLNYEAFPQDSMLYIKSLIVEPYTDGDTLVMERWWMAPAFYRTELRRHDTLLTGYFGDGQYVFKSYNAEKRRWESIGMTQYYDETMGYNFHGPLYYWKTDGLETRYEGVWNYNSNQAYRVFVSSPDRYDRYYLFEKESGLLFLIDELDTYREDLRADSTKHVNWRAYHEYTPLGSSLFPTVESYMQGETMVVIYSQVGCRTPNKDIFKKENY